jgi:hypothetical protein
MTPAQIEIEKKEQLPGQMLRRFVQEHSVSDHALFDRLAESRLTVDQAGALLKNYDAHASHLRRLLLKAATIMPEEAVGYILENVRNEYGNGVPTERHQLQLQSLAWATGVSRQAYKNYAIKSGIRQFIKDVSPFYFPLAGADKTAPAFDRPVRSRAAVAAGAITATELLALEEFKALQIAFSCFGQQHHIWFDHVTIECEHLEDSVSLALHFLNQDSRLQADVLLGLSGVLDATVHLYDGLLDCLN